MVEECCTSCCPDDIGWGYGNIESGTYDRGMHTTDAMHPLLVRLPADMLEAVRAQAAEADRSVSAEVRRALRQYLKPVDRRVNTINIEGDTVTAQKVAELLEAFEAGRP